MTKACQVDLQIDGPADRQTLSRETDRCASYKDNTSKPVRTHVRIDKKGDSVSDTEFRGEVDGRRSWEKKNRLTE